MLAACKAGKLRALAVTTEQRLPLSPDVPTIAEFGFPAYEISSWQGVFAPAGTPNGRGRQDQRRAGADAQDARRSAERMPQEGADPVGSSPEQFTARVASEIAKWSKVAKQAGVATSN